MKKPQISVIGVGYVGLCTAVGLASKGYNVIACDIDPEKIQKINQGVPPFFEPELQEKLAECIKAGNLQGIVNQTDEAVKETDITRPDTEQLVLASSESTYLAITDSVVAPPLIEIPRLNSPLTRE